MRYASMRSMDISNGDNIGVSLFVQGCHFHCEDCFNQEAWDFNGGKEWTKEIEDIFFELIDRPYIKRVTFIGGEPLANENVPVVLELIKKIKSIHNDNKDIWLYTGFGLDEILNKKSSSDTNDIKRYETVTLCDVVVDGRFIAEQKDISLAFKGSRNQRVIDINKTIKEQKIVLYK